MPDLSEMIVTLHLYLDCEAKVWHVRMGSRFFIVTRGPRGDWYTTDEVSAVLDVSDDLSGSLEYIEGLFR